MSGASEAASSFLVSALLTAWVSTAWAGGPSTTTLAGMAAYNRGDFAAAYALLRQAAVAGDPEAQVNLAICTHGAAVPRDQAEAM